MNSATFVRFTGTPTARALVAFPPAANIQFPVRVLDSSHVPAATSPSHQRMLTLTSAPPTFIVEEKNALAESNPAMFEMSFVATFPVTSRVIARLMPCSIRNVPSVTRKLGKPVRTSIHPLNAPMLSESTSATPDAHPYVGIELIGEHRCAQRGVDHRHSSGQIEFAADHEQRHSHRHDAERRALIEYRTYRADVTNRRRHDPEEHDHDDRADQRADFGPPQKDAQRGAPRLTRLPDGGDMQRLIGEVGAAHLVPFAAYCAMAPTLVRIDERRPGEYRALLRRARRRS